MPLTGTQSILGAARLAAENAVRAKWKAIVDGPPARQITRDELAQMQLEMKVADSAAIIAHVVASSVVAGAVTTGPGAGGVVTGTIT